MESLKDEVKPVPLLEMAKIAGNSCVNLTTLFYIAASRITLFD
jgi:hypothetical protein